jgi:Ca2+/Na+ antiporter
MPVEKLPELAFLVIVILYFLTTDYILKVVSVMSVYINLSHMFVGITIMSWGSCAVELINMSLSVKNNQM